MAKCFSCFARPDKEEPSEEDRGPPSNQRGTAARKVLPEHELLVGPHPPIIGTPAHPNARLGRLLPQNEPEEQFASHPEKSPAQIFTFRELQAATRNFQPQNLLGEGGFGRVYKGRLERTGQIVAVKQLDRTGLQGNAEFRVEVSMLSLLHHENLVNLIGYCADGDQRLLVYEFMPLGCLEDHLHDVPPDREPLDWYTRMRVAYGAAKGLEYLHDKADPPVIYRDFKSSNILLDVGFHPKLSDFGLAKLGPTGDKTHVSTRVMGTYGYCAPEYAMTGQLTTKSDVYSFGVVLLELITGRRAIDSSRPRQSNLVAWARPLFKDRRTFPSMADPLLQGRYPMRALYQAMAVAAMCLQETATLRPQIGDVVMALNHLANQRHDHGDHSRRSSRDYSNQRPRPGMTTPERRMAEQNGERWGHQRTGYENVRQAGARRREDDNGSRDGERDRGNSLQRGGYEARFETPRRRDDEVANGGDRGRESESSHSRKPSVDGSESYRSEDTSEAGKVVEVEQPTTSNRASAFVAPPLRQEYAYPPSTREHPAFAGTAKSAILERMPSWEARRGRGGGGAPRHRVLDRAQDRGAAARLAEVAERGGGEGLPVLESPQGSAPGWDQQSETPVEDPGQVVFDAEVPEAEKFGGGRALESGLTYGNKGVIEDEAFGSVVYPVVTDRGYDESGVLGVVGTASSIPKLTISTAQEAEELAQTNGAASATFAGSPTELSQLPVAARGAFEPGVEDSGVRVVGGLGEPALGGGVERPVGFMASPSFKASQERALDANGRVAFLWQQQQGPSANPFDSPVEVPLPTEARIPLPVESQPGALYQDSLRSSRARSPVPVDRQPGAFYQDSLGSRRAQSPAPTEPRSVYPYEEIVPVSRARVPVVVEPQSGYPYEEHPQLSRGRSLLPGKRQPVPLYSESSQPSSPVYPDQQPVYAYEERRQPSRGRSPLPGDRHPVPVYNETPQPSSPVYPRQQPVYAYEEPRQLSRGRSPVSVQREAFYPSEESRGRSPVPVEHRPIQSVRSRPRTPERLARLELQRDSLDRVDLVPEPDGATEPFGDVRMNEFVGAQRQAGSNGSRVRVSPLRQTRVSSFDINEPPQSSLLGPSLTSLSRKSSRNTSPASRGPQNGYAYEAPDGFRNLR